MSLSPRKPPVMRMSPADRALAIVLKTISEIAIIAAIILFLLVLNKQGFF